MLSALLGAVVGGLLALAGSVLVGRREVVRRARIRLYDEMIPSAMNVLRLREDLDLPLYRAIVRAATLAGPKDRAKAVALTKMAMESEDAWTKAALDDYGEVTDPAAVDRRHRELNDIRLALQDLWETVERKIAGWHL